MEKNGHTVINPFDISSNVVLCNGCYPEHPMLLSALKNASQIVCCDGATDTLLEHGLQPSAIVGDGDSISEMTKTRFAGIFHHISEQETNDLSKSVHYLSSKNVRDISILGAVGKRPDHSIGNISLLIEYYKEGINARIFTDYGVFVPMSGVTKVKTFPEQQISIFNFSSKELSAEGLEYELRPFTNWWQGTLNATQKNEISISTDAPILVFFTFDPK